LRANVSRLILPNDRGYARLHGAGADRTDEPINRFGSDFYALGVTLCQMLTGVQPLIATDRMDWFNCHIARTPVPPGER
jgi:serine/threonine protein kinase